ncbi:hypothetical protein FHX09_000331 [Rhizobium sp. BK538]|nr:hypothetical protein [Rhizobium sp. BK538]
MTEILRHAAPEMARHPGCQGHDNSRYQRQLPVDREHQQQGAGKGHQCDEKVLGAVVSDFANLFEILRQPPDDMSGLLVVEIAERQLLQMIERRAAHVCLDIDAKHMAQ